VRSGRCCSRSGCVQDSVATLTYVYSDSTAVLGPLATYAEPHSYDLCDGHAARLTAPRGWEVVRLQVDDHGPTGPSHDDLLALVEAVREAAREPSPRGARAGRLPTSAGGDGPPEGFSRTGPGRSAGRSPGRAAGRGAGSDASADQGTGRGLGRRGHLRVLGPVEVPEDVPFDGALADD